MATALAVTHHMWHQGALQHDTDIMISTVLTPLMHPLGSCPDRDYCGVTGRHREAHYGTAETFNGTTQG